MRTCKICEGPIPRGAAQLVDTCSPCSQAIQAVRTRAYLDMRKAMRLGHLPHPNELYCVDCGAFARCYDHRDYFKPLEVAPVCFGCNRKRGHSVQFLPGSIQHHELPYETGDMAKLPWYDQRRRAFEASQ